jgi:hypothetical protein
LNDHSFDIDDLIEVKVPPNLALENIGRISATGWADRQRRPDLRRQIRSQPARKLWR